MTKIKIIIDAIFMNMDEEYVQEEGIIDDEDVDDEEYVEVEEESSSLEEEDCSTAVPVKIIKNAKALGTAVPVKNRGNTNSLRSWESWLNDLKIFKEKNGHCNVVEQSGSLGRWAHNQRQYYRLMKTGKKTSLTADRIAKLEAIGFVWATKNKWEVRFQELKRFKKQHGHMNISRKHKPLGGWIQNQRQEYRFLKEGRYTPMNEYRIAKLEALEFRWNLNADRAEKAAKKRWEDSFKELQRFKSKHGNLNIPRTAKQLYRWVSEQRQQYRLSEDGRLSSITDKRKAKLENIGFDWFNRGEKRTRTQSQRPGEREKETRGANIECTRNDETLASVSGDAKNNSEDLGWQPTNCSEKITLKRTRMILPRNAKHEKKQSLVVQVKQEGYNEATDAKKKARVIRKSEKCENRPEITGSDIPTMFDGKDLDTTHLDMLC